MTCASFGESSTPTVLFVLGGIVTRHTLAHNKSGIAYQDNSRYLQYALIAWCGRMAHTVVAAAAVVGLGGK
jgi:hypothetical protein